MRVLRVLHHDGNQENLPTAHTCQVSLCHAISQFQRVVAVSRVLPALYQVAGL
jgi:hypothetical protein